MTQFLRQSGGGHVCGNYDVSVTYTMSTGEHVPATTIGPSVFFEAWHANSEDKLPSAMRKAIFPNGLQLSQLDADFLEERPADAGHAHALPCVSTCPVFAQGAGG